MNRLLTLFLLAAGLQLSLGYDDEVPYEYISTETMQVQKQIQILHNTYRRNVVPEAANMLKMNWNSSLAKIAKRWADKCFLNHSNPSDREFAGDVCGENIAYSYVCVPWDNIIKLWDDEKDNFNYGIKQEVNIAFMHYTQLVWDSTYECGCAVSICNKKNEYGKDIKVYFYVCTYYPGGNAKEKLHEPYDKGIPCSLCPDKCEKKLCMNACLFVNSVKNCDEAIEGNHCWRTNLVECNATCRCGDRIY